MLKTVYCKGNCFEIEEGNWILHLHSLGKDQSLSNDVVWYEFNISKFGFNLIQSLLNMKWETLQSHIILCLGVNECKWLKITFLIIIKIWEL